MTNPSKSAYIYISTKATVDPVRTIYVCAPGKYAEDQAAAEQFATASGWKSIAEEEGAVLVLPVVPGGWDSAPEDLLMEYYKSTRNDFHSRSGQAIWGRQGTLWCWETLLFIVGYEDGAVFAGNTLVRYPSFAASVSLIGGLPSDYEAGDDLSTHWLVPRASDDYDVRSRDIPVCLWIFDQDPDSPDVRKAMTYFQNNTAPAAAEPEIKTRLIQDPFPDLPAQSRFIFEQQITHCIRWKNSPDGTLAFIASREEFERRPDIHCHAVEVNGTSYNYYVHFPKELSEKQAGLPEKDTGLPKKGASSPEKSAGLPETGAGNHGEQKKLPVVFTVHGRGEPAWMFIQKNGWLELADETREFIVVSPDSPGNIWFLERDGAVFEQIILQMASLYNIDLSRIYLTGFSNGAVMTRETAMLRPDLFAAISPSNGPWFDTWSMQQTDTSTAPERLSDYTLELMAGFSSGDWEMPCAFFYGDSDPAAKEEENPVMELFLSANHCSPKESEVEKKGRFLTKYFRSEDGICRVSTTVMKNMPHGAIPEESRAAWNFVKQFRRPAGSHKVEVIDL